MWQAIKEKEWILICRVRKEVQLHSRRLMVVAAEPDNGWRDNDYDDNRFVVWFSW